MKRLIFYCIGAAVTAYFAILYESPLLVTVLAAELLAPVPFFLIAWQTAKKLQVQLSVPIPMAERGQEAAFELKLKNPTVFPVLCVEVRITCRNRFRNQKISKIITFWADGNSQNCYSCRLTSQHCGRLVICADRVRVRDYLGLLPFAAGGELQESLSILPGIFDLPIALEEDLPCQPGESDEFDKYRGGDDPSEIFQIRPYRAGDRMQKIHWKMTARSEDLMVKEFSFPVNCQTAVYLDLKGTKKDTQCWETADDYLETALSLEARLLEMGYRNYVVWYDAAQGRLCRKKMEYPEDIYDLTGLLFQVMPYTETLDLEEMYQKKYPGEIFAVIFRLDFQCRLWKGGALYWQKTKTLPFA